MSACIIQLADIRARRSETRADVVHEPAMLDETADLNQRFQFWIGASGKRYVHTVYSLLGCPELPPANYVLVRRGQDGQRQVLSIGRTVHGAASLNLAQIRHRGATLGANEVHVHLLAANERQIQLVEFDLRSGHGCSGHAASEPVSQH